MPKNYKPPREGDRGFGGDFLDKKDVPEVLHYPKESKRMLSVLR